MVAHRSIIVDLDSAEDSLKVYAPESESSPRFATRKGGGFHDPGLPLTPNLMVLALLGRNRSCTGTCFEKPARQFKAEMLVGTGSSLMEMCASPRSGSLTV